MPKFTVEHESTQTPDAAFEKMKSFLSTQSDIKKFDPNLQITFDDAQKVCRLKGSQFSAEMNIQPSAKGSKVAVNVDLSFLLTPFKGKVQDVMQNMLTKHLG